MVAEKNRIPADFVVSRSEGGPRVNGGGDESGRPFETSMKTIHRAETLASGGLPAGFCPNAGLTAGHAAAFTLSRTERFGGRMEGWMEFLRRRSVLKG